MVHLWEININIVFLQQSMQDIVSREATIYTMQIGKDLETVPSKMLLY